MYIYRLLKLNRRIKNHRVKFLGLYLLHKLNQRYLAVNIDPVMACNLRCKMCYFTDAEFVKTLKGQFKTEELKEIADTIFKRALKLQIGCGTEPTLFKNLPKLVKLGKLHKVPYISLTTNANLLTRAKVVELLDSGLDEFTISLHGVTKESYENFMKRGDFEKFQEVFKVFSELKKKREFTVRVNYTFNKDNFFELKEFFKNFNGNSIDILQIRPIQKIGNTEYNDFDISGLKDYYPDHISEIRKDCKRHNITLLAPNDLELLENKNTSSFVFDYTFCYISPQKFWKPDFNWKHESFNQYSRKTGWSKLLFSNIFKSEQELRATSKRLNYEIEIN